jgi:Leucine-rich repeat (LRR) protein
MNKGQSWFFKTTSNTKAELETNTKWECTSKPLDFSYLNLTDITQLLKEEPRDKGKRKPAPVSDDEQDKKKVSYTIKQMLTTHNDCM